MSDELKIAWFTPFHTDSAIGEFSQHVASELGKLAAVEIWTSDEQPWLESELPVIRFQPGEQRLAELRDRDAIIYNLGNYLDYHQGIYEVSREHPGVVILHDRVLHHLFADLWLQGDHKHPPKYIERMRVHYGQVGATVAEEVLKGERLPVWESEEVLEFPLYEESIETALAVVTHSADQARDVRDRWLGPVSELMLPSYRSVIERAARSFAGEVADLSDGRVRLLTIGHVNPNKQVDGVIRMLRSDPSLARLVDYRVAGSISEFTSYGKELAQLVALGGSQLSVEFLGRLSDEDLEHEIARADIFVNLRHPNIEGASASLMRELAYGRPVLCFDSGYFAELQRDAVVRVPPGDFDGLARRLRELLENPALRSEIGQRALAVAREHSEAAYARGLLALIAESQRKSAGLSFLDKVGGELGRMGIDARLPIFEEIADDFARVLDL